MALPAAGVAALVVATLVVGGMLTFGTVGAQFSATTSSSAQFDANVLDAFVPAAVSASRTSSSTCLVSWVPAAGVPPDVVYGVTDGSGTVLAAPVSGTSVSVTVPATQVVPAVRAQAGLWVSASRTAASGVGCVGVPGSPTVLAAVPGDGSVSLTWTAPASDGGAAITGYTATATPNDGSLPVRTCTTAAPTTVCTVAGLTNGVPYTVSVTATNAQGTGAASASVTTIAYPAGIMSPDRLVLWLDGADAATLYASDTCAGPPAISMVGCWKDKSASGNHLSQRSGNFQPTLTTVNGHSVPRFNGSSQYLIGNPSLLPTGSTTGTVVAAGAVDSSVAMNGVSILAYGGTTNASQRRITSGGQAGVDVLGAPTALASAWPAALAQGVVVGQFTGGSSVSVWAQADSGASTAGAFSTGTDHFWVGAGGTTTPSGYWKGTASEILVFTGSLNATERRTVQEYLARKWGSVITPSAPTQVAATEGDGTANVSWTAPWNGGSAITSYSVTAVPSDASLATRTCTATAPATECSLTGLTDGVAYATTVTATNSVGAGVASGAIDVVAYPTALFASSSLKLWLDAQRSSSLSAASTCLGSDAPAGTGVGCWKDRSGNGWDAPRGGSTSAVLTAGAINGRQALRFVKTDPDFYSVPASTGIAAVGSADRSLFAVVAPRTTDGTLASNNSAIVAVWTGLHSGILGYAGGGTTSIDTMRAVGYGGDGAGMVAGVPTTSPVIAGAVFATSGATLSTGLALNGAGTPVTSTTAAPWNQYTVAPFHIGSGLQPIGAYSLDGDIGEVLVFNRALTDSERRTVEEYLARHWGLAIAPSAATGVATTAGNGTAGVSWTAPWSGGAAITSYSVTASPGGSTCTATPPATSCTLTGLTNGTTYAVAVAAANSAGTGPVATTTVTPNVVPGAPSRVTAIVTGMAGPGMGSSALVSWAEPIPNGGTAILSYTATAVPGGGLANRTCTATASPCTLSGLSSGVTYTVSVTATNAAGTGPASASVAFVA